MDRELASLNKRPPCLRGIRERRVDQTTGRQRMSALLPAIFASHGWDFGTYERLTAHSDIYDRNGDWDRVTVLNSNGRSVPAPFRALHVRQWLNFGNSIRQLSNVIALALKQGVTCIYYEEEHPFMDLASAPIGVDFIRQARGELAEDDGLILSGIFFFDAPYHLFHGNERQLLIDAYLSPMLPARFRNGDPLIDNSTLTLNIRSGEIFSSFIHREYGQPPLSYYKRVVRESGAGRVVVVAQDLANPVTVPLIDFVRAQNRELVLFIGGPDRGLEILFASKQLAGGAGSFVWAIQSLSQRIERYWFFDSTYDGCVPARRNVKVGRIFDRPGAYVAAVMRSNWQKLPEQLQLMTEYPEESLSTETLADD
jgi:hypothetical protein